ncbi:MAG: DUF6263 family protein, partial [Planctomycetota bacterium]
LIVTLMALLVSPVAMAEDRIALTMNLQPGDSHTMVLDIDQTINQSLTGQQMTMDQLIGMTMTYTGLDRPSDHGGVWIEVTYDRVRFKMGGPMPVDYDSEDGSANNNPMAEGFDALVGQKLRMEFLPNGDVPNIEGIGELQQKMIDGMNLPAGPQRAAAEEALKLQFNEDMIKQMVAAMGGMYPDQPVGLGDQWEDKLEVGGMAPMSVTSTYTLTEFDDATATLAITGDIGPNPNAGPVMMSGMEMDAEFTGDQTGKVVMDRETGWVVSSEIEQNMSGGMTMNLPDGQSMELDMEIKGKYTMKPAESSSE